jgi:hypothetical protein
LCVDKFGDKNCKFYIVKCSGESGLPDSIQNLKMCLYSSIKTGIITQKRSKQHQDNWAAGHLAALYHMKFGPKYTRLKARKKLSLGYDNRFI